MTTFADLRKRVDEALSGKPHGWAEPQNTLQIIRDLLAKLENDERGNLSIRDDNARRARGEIR